MGRGVEVNVGRQGRIWLWHATPEYLYMLMTNHLSLNMRSFLYSKHGNFLVLAFFVLHLTCISYNF